MICPRCRGKGEYANEKCTRCYGLGVVIEVEVNYSGSNNRVTTRRQAGLSKIVGHSLSNGYKRKENK